MPWNLILLHSALFFIYVMIYIALLTSSLTFAGKLGPMEMNLWLVTAPVVGFFLFGFTFRRFSHKQFRQLLTAFLGILGVSIATLGPGPVRSVRVSACFCFLWVQDIFTVTSIT